MAEGDLKSYVKKFLVLRSSLEKIPYAKFRLTYKRIIVCGLSRSQKLALCSHILQNDPFEYEFFNNIHPDLSCRLLPVPIRDRRPIVPVFRCPTPHLKLGRDQIPFHVPISYYLSGALDPLTTIMYYRYAGHRVGILPYSSLQRSTMPKLAAIAKRDRNLAYEWNPSAMQLFHHDVTPYYILKQTPSAIRAPEYAENQMSYFIQYVVKNNLTYSKFVMAFNSMNICRLELSDVIHVCGKAFNGNEHGYNSKHYVPMKCRRVLISFMHKDVRPTRVHVISCGAAYIFDNEVKSFHVSSSIEKDSILTHVLYHPHVEVLPEAMIFNVTLESLEEASRDLVRQPKHTKKRKLPFKKKAPPPKRIKK